MSTLNVTTIIPSEGTNTDLDLDGKGSGVPDLGAGFKVGGTAGVPTASIQDDAVTLAKLAAGTDGELITWDASGNPATVAVGTATHVLTSNGAGAAPTFQAASAAAGSVYFSAEIVDGSQALTRNVFTVITGWTEIEDSGSVFNPTTGLFTAPSAGLYYFSASVGGDASAIGEDIQLLGMKFTDNTHAGGSGGSYPSGTFGLWNYWVNNFDLELGQVSGSVLVEMTSSGTMAVNIRCDDDNGTGTATVQDCLFTGFKVA